MESQRIEFTLEEDPLKRYPVANRCGAQQTPQVITHWHWLCQRQVRWPQHFNCHASFPASFATELHEEAYWKHLPTLFFIFTAAFLFFEVMLLLSYTCVKAVSRVGKWYSTKHRAGNFHRWNASRMRRTNTCSSRPISASALREFEPTSISNMAALAFAGWLAALLWK